MKPEKQGVIDIGTNSIRLLVASLQAGRILEGRKHVRMVRLGESVDCRGRIDEKALVRCIKALEELMAIAEREGVEGRIKALATSAVRDAENRRKVIGRIEAAVPVSVEILDGETEAEMGFKGVVAGIEESREIVVVDIGGGSTEFVVGRLAGGIRFKRSLDMGAVRMTEQFLSLDPPDPAEARRLSAHIDRLLRENLGDMPMPEPMLLVGIGGTVTTLGAVKAGMDPYDPNRIHKSVLTRGDVRDLEVLFATRPLEERRSIVGLPPERADIIQAGTLILDRIMERMGCRQLVVSDTDNLEGYLLTKIR